MLHKIKFWGTTTVGTKGQVVIPAKARERFNIKEGSQLILLSPADKPGLVLVKAEVFEQMMQSMQSGINEVLDSISKTSKRSVK